MDGLLADAELDNGIFRHPYSFFFAHIDKPPATINPKLGQTVHTAKSPGPIGFGFGSLLQPNSANSIIKSSGPVPKAKSNKPLANRI